MKIEGADPARWPTPPAAAKGWRTLLADHLRAAVEIGALGGGVAGAAIGALLVRLPTMALLLRERADRWLAFAVFVAVGVVLSTLGLALLALVAATLARLAPPLAARLRPRRLAVVGLAVALFALHGFFWLAFRVVHDLRTWRGLVAVLGLVVATLAALAACAIDWRRSPGSFPPAASVRPARLAALALLGALFLVGWGWSRLGSASERGASVAAETHAGSGVARRPSTRLPRVILISIDTLRADHLSLYGYGRPTSPALAELAADGTVFDHAHCQAPWTLPSHASLFTGKYPWAVGVMFLDSMRFQSSYNADRLPTGETTLAERLAERGYRTGGIAAMPWFSRPYGLAQGFERMVIVDGEERARQVVDRGLEWTREAGDRPFFLFLHFFDVHQYEAPAPFASRYLEGDYRGQFASRPTRAMGNLAQRVSAEDLRFLEARYDAAATYVDSELGRFFAELRRRGLYDDALIVVTADHGESFMEHGRTGHLFSLYEAELHVPLIVKPPRSFPVAGRRSAAWVGLVDVFPTVLDYAGEPPPEGIPGSSLRPVIEGAALPTRQLFAGATMFQNSYAAFENERKYVQHRIPPLDLFLLGRWLQNLRSFYTFGPPELFDLAVDPGEKHDLVAADPALASRLRAAILEELDAHRRSGSDSIFDAEEANKLRALGYL